MSEVRKEKYLEVLRWEEDVLEDREMSLRMGGDVELAEAYHRRLQEVKNQISEVA